MRFVGITGLFAKAKRFASGAASVQDEDVKDVKKLAEILRSTLRRLSELEAKSPPEAMEFEVATGGIAGAPVSFTINHNLGGPVRWWVTTWTRPVSGGAYPGTNFILVQDASSDANNLVLKSSTTGRAIIRVELASGVIEQ